MAVSYTQGQLDALREAVAGGVRTVKVDGKEVTYASTSEMLRLIAIMERSLQPSSSRISHFNPTYSRGT